MKHPLCILIFLTVQIICRAQLTALNGKPYTDSLERVIRTSNSDSIKMRMSFKLFDYFFDRDTSVGIKYLEDAKKYAGKNAYLKAVWLCYEIRLFERRGSAEIERACLEADRNLDPFTTKEAFLYKARVWFVYAAYRQRLDDYQSMVKILIEKSIPYAQKSGDSVFLAREYSTIGIAFGNLGNYAKAETYYAEALSVMNRQGPKPFFINTYSLAAQNYLLQEKVKEARPLLNRIKPLVDSFPDSFYDLEYYKGEAMYYTLTKEFSAAHKYVRSGMGLAKKLDNLVAVLDFKYLQFETYKSEGKYTNAKNILLEVFRLDSAAFAENRLHYFKDLTDIYVHLGNPTEAYKWQKKYSVLSDSLHESKLKANVNEMEIKFRSSEKEKEIISLKAKNEQADLSEKNSRLINWLLSSLSLFLMIAVALGYFFYKNNKKTSAQKEQINIAQAMLQGQEEERKRVAQDLHDGLGGMLASVKMNLSGLAREKGKTKDIELHTIINQLDNSVKELRRISQNMMPEMLLKLGLEASLRDLCESQISETLKIDFQYLAVNENIPVQEQITIYRIIQELLTNVVKHADAHKVLLQCSQNESIFFITMEDDGKGFDAANLAEKQGMGLNNIKSRIAYLNGKMEILSKQNQGTSINVEVNVTI